MKESETSEPTGGGDDARPRGEDRGGAPGEERPSGYYYDDVTGYEIYRPGEDDAEEAEED